MTPKRSSTPKNSRIIEISNYNPVPQNYTLKYNIDNNKDINSLQLLG